MTTLHKKGKGDFWEERQTDWGSGIEKKTRKRERKRKRERERKRERKKEQVGVDRRKKKKKAKRGGDIERSREREKEKERKGRERLTERWRGTEEESNRKKEDGEKEREGGTKRKNGGRKRVMRWRVSDGGRGMTKEGNKRRCEIKIWKGEIASHLVNAEFVKIKSKKSRINLNKTGLEFSDEEKLCDV